MTQAIHSRAKDTLDATEYRRVIGAFATGVAIVTTQVGNEYHGMTVNSLTSVSLDPCMLLICPRKGSATGQAIAERGAFAVHVLAEGQSELSSRFVGAIGTRFDDLRFSLDEQGLPLLPGCAAHLSCKVSAIHPAGDHEIVLGEVISCRAEHVQPLVFHRGALGRFILD